MMGSATRQSPPVVLDAPPAATDLLFLLPISQPHPLKTRTTLGVIEIVRGTRINIKDLCMA